MSLFYWYRISSKFRVFAIIGFFVFNPNHIIYSQQAYSNQKFVHYSTSNGLSSRCQFNIVQDKEGFIWIGTTDGLNRFDGYEFKIYRNIPGDSTSIGSNEGSVFIDSYGTLLINTYSGLYRYNKDHDNFSSVKTNKGEIMVSITCFTEDKFRRIWIGSHFGLFLYDPVKKYLIKTFYFEPGNTEKMIASNQIRSLYTDGESVWIGYGSGIFSEVNAKSLEFKHYKLPIESKSSSDNFINSLCVNGDSLWISTWGKGIWIFNKSKHICTSFSGLKSAFVNALCKDRNNNIWIGTDSEGLVYYDKEKKNTTFYVHNNNNSNSLSDNCISNIFIDRQNNLWLCSKNGDVNYFRNDNPFHFWFYDPGNNNELSKKNIKSVFETDDQNLWVGFQNGGLDIINLKNKSKRFINGHNLGNNTVLTIYKDWDNDIWLGTYKGGLKKYNRATGDFITYLNNPKDSSSLSVNDIRKIAEDSKGNLWIATQGGGLNKFNKNTGKVRRFLVNYRDFSISPITSDWLGTLLCDKHDNIWTGSGSGASFLSNNYKKSIHFRNNPEDSNSLSNNFVNVIFEDSEGTIWLGTNNGLNHYNPKNNNFTRYTVKDGLCNNYILGIVEDNNKNLWIGTNKGLSMLSVINGKIKNYTRDDGLITDEFNIGACFKNSRGELYFGGLEGLLTFNPENIKTNNFVPPVYITDFKLFNQSVTNYKNNDFSLNKPINQCKEIVLNHSQNIFGFKFVALNYLNQQKNLYSYKLEGFDKNWSVPGDKREVTYTNLDHGTYIFRVKACNNDGIWNETGASIKIIIKPPFWKTYWAKLFYLIFIIYLLYLFRYLILRDANYKRKLEIEKLEIEKLQEMDAQKMRFFSNISHEFRTPLTLIIGPMDKLLRAIKEENYQADLQIIQRNAKRLLRLINQLMDFRKIEVAGLEINYSKADIIKFVTDLSNVFLYEGAQRNIRFSINTEIKELYVYFDRDKLDKILYNLLSNAYKYTLENGSISVSIVASDNKLNITVEDNGCGIPYNDQTKIFQRFYQVEGTGSTGTGIGLALTNELVQLLGGSISVESEPGKGSSFIVMIPLIQNLDTPQQEKEDFVIEDVLNAASGNPYFKDETFSAQEKELPILLIVEDNADMRHYIRSEFNETHHIMEADEGIAGFEKAITEIPDLIISDIMMPGMDGVEFCEKIKTDERTSHIPLILLTALSSDEHAIAGLKCGADDYLIKPFNTAILKLKVKNIIESRKLLQSKFIKEPSASIKEIALSAIEENFLKKAYEVVENNLSNADLEGKDFAVALGMSRAQVYRKINALTGQSVKEFIRIIRLKKSTELLQNGNKNISEIAFAVGFNSATYFSRSFTEYYGVPPTRYIGDENKK